MGSMRLTAEDQRQLDAYLEYSALVGRTDGGRLLSPEEYEGLREKAAAAAAHPLRCAWVCVPTGLHCRVVGPFSRCLCRHSFREHDVLQLPPLSTSSSSSSMQQQEERELRVACKVPRCACPQFTFIPIQGSADLRCRCKHSYVDHHPAAHRCLKCGSSNSTRGPPSAPGGGPLLSKRGPRSATGGARTAAGARIHAGGGLPSSKRPQVCEGFDSPMKCSCGKSFALHETRFWFASHTQGGAHSKGGPPGAPGRMRMHQNLIPMGGLTSLVDLTEGVDRLSLHTDDPQEALREALGPDTDTATLHRRQQQQQQQQGSVDCLSLLYTPLRLP
ncbi:hypothetical protein Esti_006233 [Eimeria stiedai]